MHVTWFIVTCVQWLPCGCCGIGDLGTVAVIERETEVSSSFQNCYQIDYLGGFVQVAMLEKHVMVCIDVEWKQSQHVNDLSNVHARLVQAAAKKVNVPNSVILCLFLWENFFFKILRSEIDKLNHKEDLFDRYMFTTIFNMCQLWHQNW
jgi:hypothetical protein